MAQLVAEVANALNSELVVDIGAGQGHLAQVGVVKDISESSLGKVVYINSLILVCFRWYMETLGYP